MSDLDRLRTEYAKRALQQKQNDLKYSFLNPPYLFEMQQRERAIIQMLAKHQRTSLSQQKILEVGCGQGGVLLDLLRLGATPQNLFGIDLLMDRLQVGQTRLPHIKTSCADGRFLPFPPDSFDLVLQFTALSSILDESIQQRVAHEMLRILNKNGAILWYDFWINPNKQTNDGVNQAKNQTPLPTLPNRFPADYISPSHHPQPHPLLMGVACNLRTVKIPKHSFLMSNHQIDLVSQFGIQFVTSKIWNSS